MTGSGEVQVKEEKQAAQAEEGKAIDFTSTNSLKENFPYTSTVIGEGFAERKTKETGQFHFYNDPKKEMVIFSVPGIGGVDEAQDVVFTDGSDEILIFNKNYQINTKDGGKIDDLDLSFVQDKLEDPTFFQGERNSTRFANFDRKDLLPAGDMQKLAKSEEIQFKVVSMKDAPKFAKEITDEIRSSK